MVQQSLLEYIQRLLQQGYDPKIIRDTLLKAGYSSYDIEEAMRAAGAPKKVPVKLLVTIFVILLAVAAGLLVALKLVQPAPAELGLSLSLFSTVVQPGSDLIVTANVDNPSGRQVSGLIDFAVMGPAGKVVSTTESVSLTNRASVPVTIRIPDGSPEGAYSLRATLSYGRVSTTQTAVFDVERISVEAPTYVLEERPVVEAKQAQLTCPGGCDDLNFCTDDSCIQGRCIHAPIVPCCGNRVCESGESKESCVVDCSERPVDPKELSDRAENMASSDLAGALELCDSLAQRQYVDVCVKGVADEADSKESCERIVADDVRDTCYITFAYDNDFSVCDKLTNKYMRNSCFSLAELKKFE